MYLPVCRFRILQECAYEHTLYQGKLRNVLIMAKWQNCDLAELGGTGKYGVPQLDPVFDLPKVDRYISLEYSSKVRKDHKRLAVHFFQDDYKFERCWTGPDRYGAELSKFAYILSPDFSQYVDFPLAICIYNHYRNMWLARYWQKMWNITVVPTVMWGYEDSYDWCFDGYPVGGVVAVSNVGLAKSPDMVKMFSDGYAEMLRRLQPSKILFMTRNFAPMPGNVEYIRWDIHKEDQLDGYRNT